MSERKPAEAADQELHIFEADPNAPDRKRINPLLKLVLELGPLLVFFFANSKGAWIAERVPFLADIGGPIFVGTACFMIATAIALAVSWALTRTLPIMPLLSGIIVLVFGALTLWLQDETFIKVKPTIINSMFGIILLGGLMFGKSFLGYVFDSAFRLDAEGWRGPLEVLPASSVFAEAIRRLESGGSLVALRELEPHRAGMPAAEPR